MVWRVKMIVVVFTTSLFFSTFSFALPLKHPVFSKVYFFGDSLSDVGNNQEGFNNQAPLTNLTVDAQGNAHPGEVWVQPFLRLLRQSGFLKSSTAATVIPSRLLSDKNFKLMTCSSIDYAYSGDTSGGYEVIHQHEIIGYHSGKETSHACVLLPPSEVTPNSLCGMLNRVHQFVEEKKKIDPQALYVIWVGGNDMINGLDSVVAIVRKGGIVQKSFVEKRLQRQIDKVVRNIISSISMLEKAGARNLMVVNLPNLAYTPAVQFLEKTYTAQHAGETQLITQLYDDLTRQFNQKLKTALLGFQKHSKINLVAPDINSLFDSMRAGKIGAFPPTSFKVNRDHVMPWFSVCCPKQIFPNYDPRQCLTPDQSPLCSGPHPKLPDQKGHYLFFNSQHPTVCAHRYIAYYLFSVLPGAGAIDLQKDLC